MSEYIVHVSSHRARRARYALLLNKKWIQYVLFGVLALSLGVGGFLLFTQNPTAWLALAPGLVAGMLITWITQDLAIIEPNSKSDAIDDLLDASVLAKINTQSPSAKQIWQAISGTSPAYFLSNRYLVDSSFYDHFMSDEPGSSNKLWPIVEEYHQRYGLSGYSAIMLLVGLIRTVPDYEQLLRVLQLDMTDTETAIEWYEDTESRIALAKQNNSFGGIGRDWAFGYTPLLRRIGHNISQEIEQHGFFRDATAHEAIVSQAISALGSGGSAITLVGDPGVGKTTCVYALANRLLTDKTLPKSVRFNQIIELDAPTLIANTPKPGQLEQMLLKALSEASRAGNIILFLDDAEVFFGSGSNSVDLSHILQPIIQNGSVRVILAMSPGAWQRYSTISAVASTQPVHAAPLGQHDTIKVLSDSVFMPEYKHKVVFTYQALQEAYKLGTRYVTNLAMPGSAITLIEQTASMTRSQLVTADEVKFAVEQSYGVKLQVSTGVESSQLLELETQIKQYVISQERAISVVSDALRRSRSGVGSPDRPIGTFLFLGPTGVGKTELAKALARVYFGDEKALLRVDMNQYVQSADVNRLIAASTEGELSFISKVRKQPFSVILLDEIEKAHPSVVNTLLQVLDEGVMRDSDGKEVSFRDAIIIATSNAGADDIRRMIDEGQSLDKAEAHFTDLLIKQGAFAPEFLNRFDELVVFKPLTQDDLLQVIDIIIAGINKTLSTQKVQVVLSQEAKIWLVTKGYDVKLGARPMRRMAQRYVENVVAKRLLDGSVVPGGDVILDVSDFEAQDV